MIYARLARNFTASVGSNTAVLQAYRSPCSGLYVGINQYSTQLIEDKKVYLNGDTIARGSLASNDVQWNTNPAVSVGILAMKNWDQQVSGSVFGYFSPNNLSLVAFHKALTNSERIAWESAVNKFECALSRSVTTCIGVTSRVDSLWTKSGNNIYYNAGSVGIGTDKINAAGYKLFVEGTIRTRKLKVDVDVWPDYVFNKHYKLPSLTQTEKYIKLNQHLPGIPSAKEVQKNGVDLGDNQTLLLAKIEVLTLIAIDQNKEIDKLKTQVKSLLSSKKIIGNDKKQ